MRYRLYEIDRIVSRSISYVIVTATVVGVYAVVVTSLTQPGSGIRTKCRSPSPRSPRRLCSNPCCGRVRGAVDRRFDRAAYDGQRTADAFGQSLRLEIDQDTIQRNLVGVIEQSLGSGGGLDVDAVEASAMCDGAARRLGLQP